MSAKHGLGGNIYFQVTEAEKAMKVKFVMHINFV